MALHNSHRTVVALNFETSLGAVPANAAAWVTREGADEARRIFVETCEPTFIRGAAAVPNADMQERVGEVQPPHLGLTTADGGSMVMRLWSTGESFVTGDTVAEDFLGRMIGHALGGTSLGSHATVTAVTSTTVIEVDDIGTAAVGQVMGLEDAGDPGRVFPVIITGIDGVEITYDRVVPFTVAIGDKVVGAVTNYYAQAALTNPDDADFSSLSVLIKKGDSCWVAGGAHLELQSLAVERGQQPKITFKIDAAAGYPPGTTGAVTAPAFAEPIEGYTDVRAIGHDTKCRFATDGVTTTSEVSLFSAAFSIGCPVLPQDTVTEATSGAPGRIGYRTEPAATTGTIVVGLADAEQTKWTARTRVTLTYYQVGPIGQSWCVHLRNAFLMDSPEPQTADTNKYQIVIQASDDHTAATELAASKILIARY